MEKKKNTLTAFVGSFCPKFYINLIEEMLLLNKILLFQVLSFCLFVFVFKGTEGFVYNQHRSKESITHEKIQSNLELVLLCVSTSAVILALIVLTALR